MALAEGEDKSYIDSNDIKKFIFHDLNIQDDIFSEYLDQFGMKIDEKIYFEQFCDMLKNNKKLHENELEKPQLEEEKKNSGNNNDKNDDKNNDKNSDKSSDNSDGKKVVKKVEFKGIQIIEIKEEYESQK